MTSASGPSIRYIEASDEPAVRAFACRDFRYPYTAVVEEMVRERLIDAVWLGHARALGLWVGPKLAAVVAWTFDDGDPPFCTCSVLAVAHGHVRRGYGLELKRRVIEIARHAGAAAVVSHVHWDNDPMIELNRRLGANVEADPYDGDYCRCIIAVRQL